MNSIKIKKEEYDTTRAEIAKAESLWERNFPKDYVKFLLQYNGAVVYPNWPNLGPENNTEIWGIERFLSIGDIILQKYDPVPSSRIEIEEMYFGDYDLSSQNILVFAQGERGVYFINLAKEEYGQIYIANFAGGDGVSKTTAKSFDDFVSSLGVPEWDEEEFNENFEFSNELENWLKVFQSNLFYTRSNPAIGFQRFKEVFEFTKQTYPSEDGFVSISRKYVNDRMKLEYLLQNGCSTDGLLLDASNIDTVKYLVQNLNLDINQPYGDRYPLQRFLSPSYTADSKRCYKLIHNLLDEKINLDWSVKGKIYSGELDGPLIEKLRSLNSQYWEYEKSDKEWWIKNGKPSGHKPFFRSKLVDELLGIASEEERWVDKLLNTITRGNKRR